MAQAISQLVRMIDREERRELARIAAVAGKPVGTLIREWGENTILEAIWAAMNNPYTWMAFDHEVELEAIRQGFDWEQPLPEADRTRLGTLIADRFFRQGELPPPPPQ